MMTTGLIKAGKVEGRSKTPSQETSAATLVRDWLLGWRMVPLVDASRAGPHRPRFQAKLTLVIGGARSGKSAYAEKLALDMAATGEALYVATAEALDPEMAERIRRHRARRGERWRTVEEPLELADALARHARPGQPILVDCLTLWISNLMGAGRDVGEAAAGLGRALARLQPPVILITNEVGQGIVPENALARAFRDHAGLVNQQMAAQAESVVFIAAGLPLTLKQTETSVERAP